MKKHSSHHQPARRVRKKVRFKLKKPNAKSVAVVGTFTEWEKQPIALSELEPGLWVAEIELPAGRHEYLFLADDREWLADPEAVEIVANPWGGVNSVIEVQF